MSLNDFTKRLFSLRILIGLLAGAALGYTYFYFVGCKGNSCPMWANPWRSMLIGATFGILLLFDTKSKVDPKPE